MVGTLDFVGGGRRRGYQVVHVGKDGGVVLGRGARGDGGASCAEVVVRDGAEAVADEQEDGLAGELLLLGVAQVLERLGVVCDSFIMSTKKEHGAQTGAIYWTARVCVCW